MAATPLLEVTDLSVTLNQNKILENINFQVGSDETLALIGPNGAGKSVLFHALLGLVPFQGKIKWRSGTKIGYVPQHLALDPDLPLTVNEFFALKSKNHLDVHHALTSVGFPPHGDSEKTVTALLNRRLSVLSGGELQRVLIAWAIIGHPNVLLFDEPTSGVDISSEDTIYSLLHKLQAKENLSILLISHDLQIVFRYADTVICLNKEAVCYGPPQKVLDSKSLAHLYGEDVSLYTHSHHKHV